MILKGSASSAVNNDRVARDWIPIEFYQVLDAVAHFCDVADHKDQAISCPGGELFDALHSQIEVLGIEAAKSLIEEECVEATSGAGDHLRQSERQSQ